MPDGHDYVFYGEGDEVPEAIAGDLYFKVKTEKHPLFLRKGADLFYEKKISLLEALTGLHFELKHLDNSKLTVSTMPGDIISHSIFIYTDVFILYII